MKIYKVTTFMFASGMGASFSLETETEMFFLTKELARKYAKEKGLKFKKRINRLDDYARLETVNVVDR